MACTDPCGLAWWGMQTRGIIQALAAAAFFGISTPIAKALLGSIQTNQLAGLLYLGAAICLAPIVWRRARAGETVMPRDRKNRWRLAGAVLFGGMVGPVLVLLGLKVALAASVAMWLNLEAVATAVIAFFLFREHIGRWTWIGNIGVVLAGVMLSYDQGWGGWLGLALIAGAAIAWGIDNNLTAVIDGISPEDSTFWKGLIAGSVNLAIGLVIAAPQVSVAWLWTLLLGGLSYGASIVLYIHAAQNLGATRSQMIFAAAPFFGVALAVGGMGESLTLLQLAATGVLAVSLISTFRDAHSHEHAHDALTHEHEHTHDDGHHSHSHPDLPASTRHSHVHSHEPLVHSHPHWPDLHHRHSH